MNKSMTINAKITESMTINAKITELENKIDRLKARRENVVRKTEDLIRQETVKNKLSLGYLNVTNSAKYIGMDASRLRTLIRDEAVSVEWIGGRQYISPNELESIKNGGWLELTCKATRSDGSQCPSPVFRDSLHCRMHRPDRPANRRPSQSVADWRHDEFMNEPMYELEFDY